ncbi:MAG: 2-amino-4-hydroxy-6-hydroxymethyldihydropteridine diphosphokinase [Deltaproteobacteria bacterium]|nr:2-amino-4-hydroxy-6-hydroxymethyldihydropteridine diphosphokinase [Deltaproteobacteria bacterium]
MPHRAFIGLGTNLGNRAANYRQAIQRLGHLPESHIVRHSSIYETEPVGDIEGVFLNGVVELDTELPADLLMRRLLAIERAMGRRRSSGRKPLAARRKYQPRIIDLDLLFFDKEIIRTPPLTLPHPRLHERRFVLAPMAELAPALIHPELNVTISELLAGLKSPQRVTLARADLLRPASTREVVTR